MTNDEITKKIENITKGFEALGGQVSELASMSTERLEEYRNKAMADAKHATQDASQEVKKHVKCADEYVRKNPWAIIAGASIVSLVIGALLSQTKKK